MVDFTQMPSLLQRLPSTKLSPEASTMLCILHRQRLPVHPALNSMTYGPTCVVFCAYEVLYLFCFDFSTCQAAYYRRAAKGKLYISCGRHHITRVLVHGHIVIDNRTVLALSGTELYSH